MTGLFAAEYVVHVQYVVAVIIVIAIVFDAFARLCEDPAWIPGGLVLECRVTYPIG